MTLRIDDLFNVDYGQREYENKSNLALGQTLLISSKGVDNGAYGFFDIPQFYKAPIITVPRTGSIGQAFVQESDCCVDNNCLVLFPKEKLEDKVLYQVAYQIRMNKWRYKYGRQITPKRIKKQSLILKNIELDIGHSIKKLMPKEISGQKIKENKHLKRIQLGKLFIVENAKSNSLERHKKGNVPFVSNGIGYNGVLGFVNPLPKEKVFSKKAICLSSFCEATIQKPPFIARGNGGSGLLILTPINEMSDEELYFYASQINNEKWRFSFGRMVIAPRLKKITLFMPQTKENRLDIEYIKNVVKSRYGFSEIS